MHDRASRLAKLSSETFDILIIGGGITGAGIARDAASRGLSVALIDKGDFGSGTSSRSSRLIHGGVRYLEHGHLHLVFEASAERRRLLRLAPHLVRPLAFTWPVYRGQRLPLWKLRAGLTLYDLLSLFRNVARHERLDATRALEQEPALNSKQLAGAVRYYDAATDDARLTLANVLDAQALGASAVNHVVLTGAARADAAHVARVEDALTGSRLDIRARSLVNATGPWSDAVADLAGLGDGPTGVGRAPARGRVQGSKGSHIAVERARIGNRDAITLLHPRDGRVMFTLPAGTHTIIGTTDTFTDVSPDEVRASESDVGYLLDAANAFFPDALLRREDVVSAWAGIRPLIRTSGSSVAASREHAIATSTSGLVTITGGKLTTYRVMARDVVDAIEQQLGMRRRRTLTGQRPLPDASIPLDGAAIVAGLPWRMSHVTQAVEREHAATLGDILIRRTHVAFETRDNGRAAAHAVATFLGWGPKEVDRYETEVERIFGIDSGP
jgi:glycerol-3-phosphate dehydrogenase